ncbi:low molecular weight protein arginine phosphatase [Niallia sp. Krafla_26]|uniref:low molecular weight protein arginine phosphatase n=1 Tax=Niallia sp. Krafla_26 TaxID=3064703 RepID=UPI003D16AB43
MTNVLFVCTGNTCRSPIAESLLKHINIPGVDVKSAGTYAVNGSEASTHTKKVLDENSIPHSHKSTTVSEDLMDWADFILTMTTGHKRTIIDMFPHAQAKVFTLKEFAKMEGYPDIADPFGGSVEQYRHTYIEIKEAIEKIVDILKEHTSFK